MSCERCEGAFPLAPPEIRRLHCGAGYRYSKSPSNTFVNFISNARGHTTPKTDAAISPELLDVLRYREPSDKRVLDVEIKTAVGGLSAKGRADHVGFLTQSQRQADVIMQRLGADPGRDDSRFSPRSRTETLNTVESDVWAATPSKAWPTIPAVMQQRSPNQKPWPVYSVQNPVDIPAQTDNSIHSEASSFTVVDEFVYRQSTETDRRAQSGRNGQENDGLGNSRRVEDVRNGQGDNEKYSNNAGRPGASFGGLDQDLPALPAESSGRDQGPRLRSRPVMNDERAYSTRNMTAFRRFPDLELLSGFRAHQR
jgi:hypothetical protein